MVRSHTDDNKGTETPRLAPKVWTVGSIPVTDKGFLDWCEHQTKKRTALSMMKLYVQQLNIGAIVLHERQQKEQKEQSHLVETAETVLSSEPAESLTTRRHLYEHSNPQSPEHFLSLLPEHFQP
jgi:hypothetical protein